MRTAVVLPAPFGPSTPSTVPASTVRSTPRNASTGAALRRLAPKVLRSPSTMIAESPTPPTLGDPAADSPRISPQADAPGQARPRSLRRTAGTPAGGSAVSSHTGLLLP